MKNSIEVKDIEMVFQDKKVLDHINLCIEEGEIFGLLGSSGAGKTTLIKILTGQLKQTQGVAQILGESILKFTSRIYAQMGMVLDQTGLYERLSCYDNLELFTSIYGISKNKIKESLKRVGLEEAVRQPVYKLSRGMRQRLVLARAIMHEPKILFLDEPTSALDPATSLYIHELILEEKEKGTTIFLTTHNMEEAAKLCDHIVLLNEGHIVEYGVPQEICKRYDHQRQIQILLSNGETCILKNQPESGEQIKHYFEKQQISAIHSMEPTLETVFIELTGRRLV